MERKKFRGSWASQGKVDKKDSKQDISKDVRPKTLDVEYYSKLYTKIDTRRIFDLQTRCLQ